MDIKHSQILDSVLSVSLKKYGRKRFIEDCVRVYRSDFNAEYIEHLKTIKEIREKLDNDFGSVKKSDIDLRWGISIPTRLFNLLSTYLTDPAFLSDKAELRWMMKTFPEFCVPKTI